MDIIVERELRTAFADGYQAGLEAARPKWISVEERLPKQLYDMCLVCADGFIEVAIWALDKHGMCTWFFVDGEYETGVTHWMPLPEPPKEE